MTCYYDFYDCAHMLLYHVSRTDRSMTINFGFYDAQIQISIFLKNIQNRSYIMQKNGSNLVVKTVCELDIQMKSYREKNPKVFCTCSLSLSSLSVCLIIQRHTHHNAIVHPRCIMLFYTIFFLLAKIIVKILN